MPLSPRSPLAALLFIAGAAFSLTPWSSPALSLALGIALALLGLAAFEGFARKAPRSLIQACIVLLGFSMDLRQVLEAGATGLLFAAGTIVATFALGALLGGWLGIEPKLTALLSAGTAICGGSAIAATGSVIGATGAQMSVALATVFILNAAGLYLYPPLGHWLGLSQTQFGTWAAVGIHDVSSVVGAATMYGESALQTATAVKLSRTLWIVPVAIGASRLLGPGRGEAGGELPEGARRTAGVVPWFIGLFLLAAAIRTASPAVAVASPDLVRVAKAGMSLALFLIGTGLSRRAIAAVGWRPLALGVALWVFISVAALVVVRAMVE